MTEYRSRTEKRRAAETSSNKNQKPSKKKSKGKRSLFKKLIISFAIVIVVGLLAGVATAAAIISGAPELDPDELMLAEGATVYDVNDNEIGRLHGNEARSYRTIEETPQHVQDAFIAVEDMRFYDHMGVDVRRVGGAVIANITGGFGSEGASTITQQVVRNAFLSADKSMSRKVQEQWLALQLERQFSKDEIMEMYLNIIYFSHEAYGIGEASIRWFDKESLEELTIADAAVLAAVPRRPSYYNPIENPENAENRRNLIISMMEDQELITNEEAEEARNTNIEDQLDYTPADDSIGHTSFINHVMREIEQIDGLEIGDLYAAGFDVYTTIDVEAQRYAEQVIQTNDYISGFPDDPAFQVGFTMLNTNTGGIAAIVGDRGGEEVLRGDSYAMNRVGQPGSTVKPMLDFGPAIDNLGWGTGQTLVDEPHSYSDGTQIRNASGNYSGQVTMREALVRSLNIPALKAHQEVGKEEAHEFANRLGMEFDSVEEGNALGSQYESPETIAGAYAAFGNDGVYNDPYSVRKIVFTDEREMDLTPESTRAMNDYTAYMVTDMLKDVVTDPRGTGTAANIEGLPLAGKTGTSNFGDGERDNVPAGGVPDIWFAGYTPEYTAAVWTGYENRGAGYLLGEEHQLARNIFRTIMTEVHAGMDVSDFQRPDSVCEQGGELYICGGTPDMPDEPEVSEEISDLTAGFDEGNNQIIVSWNFPDEAMDGVNFIVRHGVNGQGMSDVQESSDRQFVLTDPERESTHNFEVVAVRDGEPIDSAQTSVEIAEAIEEEDPEEDEEENEEEEAPEEDQSPPEDAGESDEPTPTPPTDEGDNGEGEGGSDGDDSSDDGEDPEEETQSETTNDDEDDNEE
ncbi:transglycosylase domain-containing protein [Geomicrobium sp. JSM 1781026]|uniref:transglycosylase domain-containing protein n=1 Tax=Geomicrobium sp. JSM 1781026 TaxID=3344580 RepID=UPI0035C1A424